MDAFGAAWGYLEWASRVESLLRANFVHPMLERLHSERYWHISAVAEPRITEMVRNEIEVQTAWLERIAAAIEELTARFRSPSRPIVVVDTHVLLHYRLFNEVDWLSVVEMPSLRLVVPLCVVDELDEKKSARRPDIARRAATVIRHLEPYARADSNELRTGVELEIVASIDVDNEARNPVTVLPDIEILDTCEALGVYAGDNSVHIITGDLGMRLRAQSRGIAVKRMPEALAQREEVSSN